MSYLTPELVAGGLFTMKMPKHIHGWLYLKYLHSWLLVIAVVFFSSVTAASLKYPEVEDEQQSVLIRLHSWLPDVSGSLDDLAQQGRYLLSDWTGFYQGATDLSDFDDNQLAEVLDSLRSQICYLGNTGPLLDSLYRSSDLYYFGDRVMSWDKQVNMVLVSVDDLPYASHELLMAGNSKTEGALEVAGKQVRDFDNGARVACFGLKTPRWRQIGYLLSHHGFLSTSQGFSMIANRDHSVVVRLGSSRLLAYSPDGHQNAARLALELGRVDSNDIFLLTESPEAYHVRADVLSSYANYGYARYVEVVRIEDIFPGYYGQLRSMLGQVSLGGVAVTTATILVLGKLFSSVALTTVMTAGLSLGILLPILAPATLDSWTIYDTHEHLLPLVTLQSMFGSALKLGGSLISYLGAGINLFGQGVGSAVQYAPNLSLITGIGALLGVVLLPYGVPFGTLLIFGAGAVIASGAAVIGMGLLVTLMYMYPSRILTATNSLWNGWNSHQK